VRERSVLRLVLWLLLVAACGWMLLFGAVILFGGDTETRLGGLAFVIPGGVVALAAGIALKRLPAPPRPVRQPPSAQLPDDAESEFSLRGTGPFAKRLGLRVGPEGFEIKSLIGTVRQSWDDVERFRPVRVGTTGLPRGFGSVEVVTYTVRGHRSLAQRFARWRIGFDRSLPTLEAPPKQLAEVLERYREQYSIYP
jgi:hypothetical protein